jgi:GTP-binding protein EngB required for normal cell division
MDDINKHKEKMLAELKERNVSVRCNRVQTKLDKVRENQKNLKVLVTSYPVKVADSCPLAIENQRQQSKLARGNQPMSEQEIEKLRLERMKK